MRHRQFGRCGGRRVGIESATARTRVAVAGLRTETGIDHADTVVARVAGSRCGGGGGRRRRRCRLRRCVG